MGGEGGPDSASGCVCVEEFIELLKDEVIEGFEGMKQDLCRMPQSGASEVAWLVEGVLEVMRAAEFWTSWSLSMDFADEPKRRELQ